MHVILIGVVMIIVLYVDVGDNRAILDNLSFSFVRQKYLKSVMSNFVGL